MTKWIKDRKPDKDGSYLCITGVKAYNDIIYFMHIIDFTHDLYKIDPYDFYKYRYKRKDERSGWYNLDSEYGYYEITNVYAWCKLPEMPEEFRKEAENV